MNRLGLDCFQFFGLDFGLFRPLPGRDQILPSGNREHNLSYISDLVLARQELQQEEYLDDIHERIEYLSAAHRYAEENPLDPIVRDEYGPPCRKKRVSFKV